jgi:hypothetical protein
MTTLSISPIDICPINFKKLALLHKKANNLEEALLLSKLKFHQQNSKLTKNKEKCMSRSRRALCSWFGGFSLSKIDKLLSSLKEKSLISKTVGMWHGKKQLFISVDDTVSVVPANLSLLDVLIKETGSLKAALIYSKLAFGCANTKIIHDDTSWCCVSRESLSAWAEISKRTLDGIILSLIKKGFLVKKNFSRYGKNQNHYNVPVEAIEKLKKEFDIVKQSWKTSCKKQNDSQAAHKKAKAGNLIKTPKSKANLNVVENKTKPEICTSEHAKKSVSIRKVFYPKDSSIINTGTIKKESQYVAKSISTEQETYLKTVLNKNISKFGLKISNPKELFLQMKYWLSNKEQQKGITSFHHAVGRIMKILRSGNWRTPFGFYNHSESGKALKLEEKEKSKNWKKEKLAEISKAKKFTTLQNELKIREESSRKEDLTKKAIGLAEKIAEIDKMEQEKKMQLQDISNTYIAKLKEMFDVGADKMVVKNFLKNHR